MRSLFTFTLPAFIIAMSLLSAPVAMSVVPVADPIEEDSVVGNRQIGDNPNVFVHGYAWIGRFRHNLPDDNNGNTSSIYAEHDFYAHHYSTEDKVNYSLTFKLQVQEAPNYIHEHGLNGQMDKYDADYAMPQNYISQGTYTYVDVTGLQRLPPGVAYTAQGYTLFNITNPDGENLELKAECDWYFVR